MVQLANNAKMTTNTTGTGDITFVSTVSGYQDFASAGVVDGLPTRYKINDGAQWEIGLGIFGNTATTMARSVSESSNSNSPISLSGSATVFVTIAKEDIQQTLISGDNIKTIGGLSLVGSGNINITPQRNTLGLINGDFETGDLTGWTTVSGSPSAEDRTVTFSSVTTAANGTYVLSSGSVSFSAVYQDITLSSTDGVILYEVTADYLKDYADADRAHIIGTLYDSSGNALSESSFYDLSSSISYKRTTFSIPADSNAVTLRIYIGMKRNDGNNNNCGVDNIVVNELTASAITSSPLKHSSTSGATQILDFTNDYQTINISETTTNITFNATQTVQEVTAILDFANDTTSYTINFPANLETVTLNPQAFKSVYKFLTVDGGTTYTLLSKLEGIS